ncbi:unnamed protein product [Clonostachys rhizophaga]|uniref:Uncharacterized protein n=1 Tax=Clonostachys rhizophaga TaxID=160324 RepID=A0A9N9VQ27_9HYPO|nr:unnamed protein product [Clonostachys rhizophaga]
MPQRGQNFPPQQQLLGSPFQNGVIATTAPISVLSILSPYLNVMGNGPHELPWEALAANLEWRAESPCTFQSTNYHFQFKADQSDSIRNFINTMASAIKGSADRERLKYPDQYIVPAADDIMIDMTVARKIAPLIHKLREDGWYWKQDDLPDAASCQHLRDDCPGMLPLKERKMSAFLRVFDSDQANGISCPFDRVANEDVFFNLEVFKALVICGEMDILLRICSHPDVHFSYWLDGPLSCDCDDDDDCGIGDDNEWAFIANHALWSFITLNLMSWLKRASTSGVGHPNNQNVYRDTEAYQEMVFERTRFRCWPLAQYQHMFFFGIAGQQFHEWGGLHDETKWKRALDLWGIDYLRYRPLLGYGTYEDFLDCQGKKLPENTHHTATEISQLRSDLVTRTQLPNELIDRVLEEGEYDTPTRLLQIPHDPLHPANRKELHKYLEECWALLVRSEILVRALNSRRSATARAGGVASDHPGEDTGPGIEMDVVNIDWETEIGEVIQKLFGCTCCLDKLKNGEDIGFVNSKVNTNAEMCSRFRASRKWPYNN